MLSFEINVIIGLMFLFYFFDFARVHVILKCIMMDLDQSFFY